MFKSEHMQTISLDNKGTHVLKYKIKIVIFN